MQKGLGTEARGKGIGPVFSEYLAAQETAGVAIEEVMLIQELQGGLGLSDGHLGRRGN